MLQKISKQLSRQRGSTILPVLGALMAFSGFGAAVTAGVGNNFSKSNRDLQVKRALAAAESGTNDAKFRLNTMQPTAANPCVTITSGAYALTTMPSGSTWCAAQSVDLGNGASASYQIGPYSNANGVTTRKVVSTGTANSTTRRVAVTTGASTGSPLFASPFGMSSDQTLTMSGNGTVNGSIRSNQNITMSGNAAVGCQDGVNGNATPGPGYSVGLSGNASVCGSTQAASSPFTLTPIDQGNAPTNNDNGRFFSLDPKTDPGVSWNSSTRTLSLSSNSTLTLGGQTYSFCRLSMSGNARLIIAQTATVRIYIDTNSNCGLSNGSNQFSMSGNALLINTSQNPTQLQIYMMGGTANSPNTASLSGNATSSELTFYAPYTNLSLSGNGSVYKGALAARTITVSGNGATVNYDSSVSTIDQTTIGTYQANNFVECSPSNGGASPDSGC